MIAPPGDRSRIDRSPPGDRRPTGFDFGYFSPSRGPGLRPSPSGGPRCSLPRREAEAAAGASDGGRRRKASGRPGACRPRASAPPSSCAPVGAAKNPAAKAARIHPLLIRRPPREGPTHPARQVPRRGMVPIGASCASNSLARDRTPHGFDAEVPERGRRARRGMPPATTERAVTEASGKLVLLQTADRLPARTHAHRDKDNVTAVVGEGLRRVRRPRFARDSIRRSTSSTR